MNDRSDTVPEDFESLIARAESMRRSAPDDALAAANGALRIANDADNRLWRARTMAVLGHLSYSRADYPTATEYFERALEIGRQDGSLRIECDALLGLGFVGESTGRFVGAAESLVAALAIARELGDRCLQGYAHNALGNVLSGVGDSGAAFGHYEHALEIFLSERDANGQFSVRNNIGAACLALDDDDGALEQLTLALEIAEELDNQQARVVALVNLGNSLERLDRTNEAVALYEQSLDLCRRVSAPAEEAYVLMSMGGTEITRENAVAALELSQRARALARSIGSGMEWTILGGIGQALQMLGRHQDAIESLHEALAHTETDGDATYVPLYHERLATSYEALGDTAAALRHRRLEARSREELAGIEKQRMVTRLKMREQMTVVLAERDLLAGEAAALESRVASTTGDVTEIESTIARRNAFIATLRGEIDEFAADIGGVSSPQVQAISNRLRHRLDEDRAWQGFTSGFEFVHPGFIRALTTMWPALTRMEIRICVLLRLELSTKEMAELLFTSTRTIHFHRLNIRRKLELSRADDLGNVLRRIVGA